jgi:photosystem II stability/assembly factor-like uncharacterized protein
MLKHTILATGLGLAAIATIATIALKGRSDEAAQGAEREISGAYDALSFWGDSRAYPARDIPPAGFMRAYEHAQAMSQAPGGVFGPTATGPQAGIAGRLVDEAWRPLGPTNNGGRTLALAFDPLDTNTIYAGSAAGGLWRSTTGGVGAEAWDRIDTGFPTLGVSSITFEPGNPNVIYIGTGEVYNHGAAGDTAADRRTRGSYGIGILKSVDGGATWSKSLDWSYDQRRGVWAVRVDPIAPSTVWAATTEGVYKSDDAGQTWTQKLGVVMATDLVVHPLDPEVVLVGCGNLSTPGRGIYRTVDGGDTWAQVTGGGVPADFMGKIQFGVTPADPDLVFASVGNGFSSADGFTWLLRSTNFGANFALRSTTDYSRYQGWFAHDVGVSPVDPDDVICIGIDIWTSSNGGASLTQVSNWFADFTGDVPPGGPEGPPNYSHADHHDILFHPTDPSIVYFANDGGVFRSLDGGATFEGVNGGYQTTMFYNGSVSSATDPNLALGGLQDNATVIYRGHPDGRWTRGVLGGDGGWGAIDATNPDVIYATAQFLLVGKSTDGGVGFSIVSPPDLGGPVVFMAPILMSPTDSQVLYAGSSYLFRTPNGGNQWITGQGGTPIDGNPILVLAAAEQNGDALYLATAPVVGRGTVHRSLDGGTSFTEITGTLPDRYPGDMTVDPTDEATVYITMSGFGSSHVFRSMDYGATWQDIDSGLLPDIPTNAVVVDPLHPSHVYIGNDIGAFATVDGGATWIQLEKGLSEAVLVYELNISVANRKLRAFTHGRGAFERNLIGG